MHDISLWQDLKRGDELIIFATGTSLFYVPGCYYATVCDNAIGHRIGAHDRDGFQISNRVVTYHEFKSAIDSVNRRDKIRKKSDSALERYRFSNGRSAGWTRLWGGNHGNGVYADGIYVAHWAAPNKHIRHIYIMSKRGRIRVLTKGDDDQIVARVRRFLIKQNCSDQEFQECLTEVRFHLENRTSSWSSSWGSAMKKI